MDPIIGGSVILAATQLLGGLLGQKAASEQQERSTLAQIGQQQASLEQAAIQQGTQSRQSALSNLVEAYRSALLR